ncbi:membrane protein insertase YidC [Actinophytocola xanthii]|uniref:Membrane protein insertase YidC n=1 Tax=Actinophytocola xanthii TaxID=1912961 RepID=A0A1Q8CVB9_9PSEU|nr:membrane protein insertase YidC [Actinophytocola xanthii]OLF18302.1 membrane protein insertase YidC [Actinophytocola xanthii]
MLEFIYYPVSFILWCWHWVFGHVFGEASGISWVLGIMFLVFTLRAIMFKPFVKQVRSMRAMQEFAPEIKKIQKKYANDRQRQAQEMQKLQREHGFSPLGGCLPMLLQIPVFIGLFHVLRSFGNSPHENYFFGPDGVSSYLAANLFGARLSNFITQPEAQLTALGANRTSVIIVSIPLMILASVLTHLTARHSVERQNPEAATPQTAIMNKLTLYIFPLGVLIFGLFFPIGLLLYWLANNTWTLGQQRLVYRKIDAEEEAKKAAVVEKRNTLAPKPGQRPQQAKKRPASATDGPAKPAAAKPADRTGKQPGVKPAPNAKAAGTAKPRTTKPGTKPAAGTAKTGTAKTGAAKTGAAKSDGGTAADNGSAAKATGGDDKVSGLSADRSRKKNTGRKNR